MFRFAVALLFVFFLTASIIAPYRVVSPSMEDTLLVGDVFLAMKFHYGLRLPFTGTVLIPLAAPAPGDIIILEHPIDSTETLVKRCVAVGGQTLEISEKHLIVDGREIPLPAGGKHADSNVFKQGDSGKGKRDFYTQITVPDNTIFVMGDNRDFSIDSRIFGPVPLSLVRGKVGPVIFSSATADSLGNGGGIRFERMFKAVK